MTRYSIWALAFVFGFYIFKDIFLNLIKHLYVKYF